MWKTPLCGQHLTYSLWMIHRWHIFQSSLKPSQLEVNLHRTQTSENRTNAKLFIYSFFPARLTYLLFLFAINVLQTASPCLWVLLHWNPVVLHYYSWTQTVITHRTHQGICFLKSANENAIYISVNCSSVLFLYLKYPSGLCEPNTNTSIDSTPLCLLFPPSSANESDGSVNCMQRGDWLQHWGGGEQPLIPWEPFPYELLCIIFCIKHALCPLWRIKSDMTAFWS